MFEKLYAQETCFYSTGGLYPPRVRVEIAKELGYSGLNPTLIGESWNEFAEVAERTEQAGMQIGGIWYCLDVAAGDYNPALDGVIDRLAGGSALLEISMHYRDKSHLPSAPAGDDAAVKALAKLAARAQRAGLRVSLYPHLNFWMETVDDAMRLMGRVGSPNVGLTFPVYHWLGADGTKLDETLDRVWPRVTSLVVCGTTKSAPRQCTIETLDEGKFDLFWLLSRFRNRGFSGPASLLGFAVAGDVYANLGRSMSAWRDMVGRLKAHPEWFNH